MTAIKFEGLGTSIMQRRSREIVKGDLRPGDELIIGEGGGLK